MLWVDIGLLAGGLVVLFLGGEALVRGSVALAAHLGVSKLLVGLIVVGFGTSAPELLVSVRAALSGAPDIAVGNVVGSNIANILLVTGLAAVIAPLAGGDRKIRRDVAVMVALSAGLVVILRQEEIGRALGLAMLATLFLYLVATYVSERSRERSVLVDEAAEVAEISLSAAAAAAAAVVGLVFLVVGARLMVEGAVRIARDFGISEAVIGLTVVAVGTSLPEIATVIVAAFRRHTEVVVANVVGSNIFNILAILGATAMVSPIPVAGRFGSVDGPVMLGAAIVGAVMLIAVTRIGRRLGLLLLLAYAAYIAAQGFLRLS